MNRRNFLKREEYCVIVKESGEWDEEYKPTPMDIVQIWKETGTIPMPPVISWGVVSRKKDNSGMYAFRGTRKECEKWVRDNPPKDRSRKKQNGC